MALAVYIASYRAEHLRLTGIDHIMRAELKVLDFVAEALNVRRCRWDGRLCH